MATSPVSAADRVRERMRDWMETTGLDQRTFSDALGKSQVWLQKVLKGENHVRLRDLDQVADAMRTSASELVRDDSARYTLECSPSEVRLIERLRHQPDIHEAVTTIINARFPAVSKPSRPVTDVTTRRAGGREKPK
jgi:transcriptional regulator with XRE-family HTH domain